MHTCTHAYTCTPGGGSRACCSWFLMFSLMGCSLCHLHFFYTALFQTLKWNLFPYLPATFLLQIFLLFIQGSDLDTALKSVIVTIKWLSQSVSSRWYYFYVSVNWPARRSKHEFTKLMFCVYWDMWCPHKRKSPKMFHVEKNETSPAKHVSEATLRIKVLQLF